MPFIDTDQFRGRFAPDILKMAKRLFHVNYLYWVRHMTLELRQQDLSEKNSATTVESVLLGRVANKDWVTGSIPVCTRYIHLCIRPPCRVPWASLLTSTAIATEKMEQRARLWQKTSLFFRNFYAQTVCGIFLWYIPLKEIPGLTLTQNIFRICFHCKKNLKWKCFL